MFNEVQVLSQKGQNIDKCLIKPIFIENLYYNDCSVILESVRIYVCIYTYVMDTLIIPYF